MIHVRAVTARWRCRTAGRDIVSGGRELWNRGEDDQRVANILVQIAQEDTADPAHGDELRGWLITRSPSMIRLHAGWPVQRSIRTCAVSLLFDASPTALRSASAILVQMIKVVSGRNRQSVHKDTTGRTDLVASVDLGLIANEDDLWEA